MPTIFRTGSTPVAVYPTKNGIKGLITIKVSAKASTSPGDTLKAAVIAVQGSREPNAQVIANLNNEAYYSVFGDKMTTFMITCVDLPGTCGGKRTGSVMRLKDAVSLMNTAVDKGKLPTVKVVYASAGSKDSVTIHGYLVNIPFALQQQYRGTVTLVIQGYVR